MQVNIIILMLFFPIVMLYFHFKVSVQTTICAVSNSKTHFPLSLVVKKLADFELPYVSLRSSEEANCKVGLRKW